MISDQWDIVRVPFPFTDRAAVKKRPAAVLSTRVFNSDSGHTIMAMITKRDKSTWPDDYDIQGWEQAGLRFPSWIRLKLFTLENTLLIDRLGVLQSADVDGFQAAARPALW
jgi:mRNA interferase MazF